MRFILILPKTAILRLQCASCLSGSAKVALLFKVTQCTFHILHIFEKNIEAQIHPQLIQDYDTKGNLDYTPLGKP